MLVRGARLNWTAYIGLCWLTSVWLLAYFLHLNSGFISKDEVFFATKEFEGVSLNRTLWLLINQFTGLFTENVIETMRVLNFGFVVLLYVTALRVFKTFHPLLLAFVLSYASCVAALNFRDVAIMLGLILFLDLRSNYDASLRDLVRMIIKGKWILLFLALLRPTQAVLLLASGLRWYQLLLASFLALTLLQTPIGNKYFYNFSYYTINFNEEVTEKAESKGLASTEPTLQNIAYWSARFVFAPSPISVASRVFSGSETYTYGAFDLSIRFINRLSIYGLFIGLIYYFIQAPLIFVNAVREKSFAVKFGFLFSLLYALFNFGASHERIKMTLLLVLLFILDHVRRQYLSRRVR